MPRPTRNSAWVVVPRWSRPAARAARLDRGDVDVGGQVLAADVDVRVVVDAMAEVGAERAVAAPDRVVELGRGVAVVDEQQDAALEAGRRRVHPGPSAEGDLGALALGELDGLLREAGGEGRRGRIGLDVDERAVARPDQDLAQDALPNDDAVDGEGVEDLVGEDEPDDRRCARLRARRGRLRGRPPPGAPRWPRAGAARPRSGRSAGAPRGPDARRPGRPGPRAPASPFPRRIRAARTGPAGRAGPRRPRRPGRARRRRSGAPPGRSGSRRRGRGAPPRPGSSRRRGRTGRGP